MTEPEAWLAFVAGARAWAEHAAGDDKIKFQTPSGYVYVSVTREVTKRAKLSFSEIDEAGDIVGRDRAA